MIALVTGGAGFIGSELVRQLERSGVKVRVFDNFASGRRSNLAGTAAEVREGDVRDGREIAWAMRGVERVFHLACVGVRRSIHAPREAHEVNAEGTLNVLEAARAEGVARFVQVSSSEVYGTAQRVPMTEDHPCFPATAYGASKLAGEAYARAWHASYGLAVTVVRPFNSFGPRCHHEGDAGEVIPKFVLRAWAGRAGVVFGDGRQTRDFTYVADTAAGIRKAGEIDAPGQTFNLGSGRETSILELARLCGLSEVIFEAARPGHLRRMVSDSRRAREALGFEPRVTLPQGLALLRAWYARLGVSPETLLADECTHNWRPDARAADEAVAG